MNVNLTPELERLIHEKVQSGLYNNQSEVVREALRLLVEQDRLRREHTEKLSSALVEGLAQADRGELIDGEEVVRELQSFLQARRKAAKGS